MKKRLRVIGGTLAFVVVATYYRLFVARKARASYPHPEALITDPPLEIQTARESDGRYHLRWTTDSASVTIYAGTQPDQIDLSAPVATVQGTKEAVIAGLEPRRRYYFEAHFTGGSADGRRLKTAERSIPIQGVVNFRDIGGYRTKEGKVTRWGRIYRSGAFNHLDNGDMDKFERLGIRLVCDLRTQYEATARPDVLPEAHDQQRPVQYWLHPILTDAESSQGVRAMLLNLHRLPEVLTESYIHQMLSRKATAFGAVLRRMADPDVMPMVIHCTAGKDRTGLTTMLLLSLLGVPDDVILADYSLSNRDYRAFIETQEDTVRRLRPFGITLDDMRPAFMVNPATLRAAINFLNEKYGSVEAYLRTQAGLDDDTIRRLRSALLED